MKLAGEDRLLHWLRRHLDRGRLPLLGHDSAILPESAWAVTVDQQIEGVHFLPGLDPAGIARRLLAVNLSDLAATGAIPAYALLALAAPSGFDHLRFFSALAAACERSSVRLAGGDLAREERVHASLTLFGRRPLHGRWLRRSGARSGHRLWIGGTLGEAAAGLALLRQGARCQGSRVALPRRFASPPALALAARRAVRRHLQPEPQLTLGRWLGRQSGGAAIDVSDGLARDLHRLCRASGVGAQIEAAELPAAPSFARLAQRLGREPLDLALGGGEDYVLLFTLRPDIRPPGRFGCKPIGTIVQGGRVRIRAAGVAQPLPPSGWDHL